jgi:hypothetical protein
VAIQSRTELLVSSVDANADLVLTPVGNGGIKALSSGNKLGTGAVDWQLSRGAISQTAQGNYSFAAGQSNTITTAGTHSVAIGASNSISAATSVAIGTANTVSALSSAALGESNIVSGNYAFAANRANTASGAYSAVIGGGFSEATALSGLAHGLRASANRYAIKAHAGGMFAATGDAQKTDAVLFNKTTTNSAVELFLDGSSTRLTVPAGKVMAMRIAIAGIKSDGSAVAHYLRQYAIKNVSGTTSEVYSPVVIGTDNAAGTSINVSFSDVNDALSIQVTGITSETWRWTAEVESVEIAFGN